MRPFTYLSVIMTSSSDVTDRVYYVKVKTVLVREDFNMSVMQLNDWQLSGDIVSFN